MRRTSKFTGLFRVFEFFESVFPSIGVCDSCSKKSRVFTWKVFETRVLVTRVCPSQLGVLQTFLFFNFNFNVVFNIVFSIRVAACCCQCEYGSIFFYFASPEAIICRKWWRRHASVIVRARIKMRKIIIHLLKKLKVVCESTAVFFCYCRSTRCIKDVDEYEMEYKEQSSRA